MYIRFVHHLTVLLSDNVGSKIWEAVKCEKPLQVLMFTNVHLPKV